MDIATLIIFSYSLGKTKQIYLYVTFNTNKQLCHVSTKDRNSYSITNKLKPKQ